MSKSRFEKATKREEKCEHEYLYEDNVRRGVLNDRIKGVCVLCGKQTRITYAEYLRREGM